MNLLLISIILLLALIAINLSNKSGLPSLLLFLVLGILCSQLGIQFEDYYLAENFSTVALVMIMFYGGFGTNWKMGKPVVKEAAILASLGVVVTALLTGAFAHWVLHFDLLESLLLGSIVGSTDYSSVSNVLKSKNLNLKYNTASLLELESGSNDPAAYTMTILFLSLLKGSSLSVPLLIVKQVGLGLIFGFVIAFLVNRLLKVLDLRKDGLAIVFMFAMALFTYSACEMTGGNGYLAAYIMGISIGNQAFRGKKDIVFFFDGFTSLMSIGLFFLLGLLATPEKILVNLPLALIIMLFMSFIARPLMVYLLMAPFKLKPNQLFIISWAGLRGAAAIAFAILAINSGEQFNLDIYHLVFGICFLSSFFQASLMAPLTKKLQMIDDYDSVLRTFNYYSDKGEISFIKATIHENSPFVGRKIADTKLQTDFIIANIIRDNQSIVPRGDVVIQAADQIIMVGEEYFDPSAQDLLEFTISSNHPWVDKQLHELKLPQNQLVLSIERQGKVVKAEGKTQLHAGDRVIVYQGDHHPVTNSPKEKNTAAP